MKPRQEFYYLIDLVCEIFEVSKEDLLSKRRNENIVDARSSLCHCLSIQGITNKMIAQWTGMTSRGVAYLLARYEDKDRCNLWYHNLMQTMREKARQTAPFPLYIRHDNKVELIGT